MAEDLQLGLVGEPPLRGAPQSWRGLGARGDDRERHQPVSASLSNVWQALHDSLGVIQRRATPPPDSAGKPDHPGTEAA